MRINRLPLISQTILFTSHTTNNAPFFDTMALIISNTTPAFLVALTGA